MSFDFTLKNTQNNIKPLINQYTILFSTVYILNRDEIFIESEYKLKDFYKFFSTINKYNKVNNTLLNDNNYKILLNYFENENNKETKKERQNRKKFLHNNTSYFLNNFFLEVESYSNIFYKKLAYIFFVFGISFTIFFGLLLLANLVKQHTPSLFIILSLCVSIILSSSGYFLTRIYNGISKFQKLKALCLININCCYKKLTEIKYMIDKYFTTSNINTKPNVYSNPDDENLPLVKRIREENNNLPANIINVFLELKIIEPDGDKFKVIKIQNLVTYLKKFCPNIQTKEYFDYFSTFEKPHQIDNNNLNIPSKLTDKTKGKINKFFTEIEKKCNSYLIEITDNEKKL